MAYKRTTVDWDKLTNKQNKDVALVFNNIMAKLQYKSPVGMTLAEWLKDVLATSRYIYECGSKAFFTGLWSGALVDEIEHTRQVGESFSSVLKTREHAIGRHRMAEMLEAAMAANLDMDFYSEFRDLFASIGFFNKTKSFENNAVKKYIDAGHDWITAYEMAGIILYYIIWEPGWRKVIKEAVRVTSGELRENLKY